MVQGEFGRSIGIVMERRMVFSRVNGKCQIYKPGMAFFAFRGEIVSGNILVVIGVFCVLLHFFFARLGPTLMAMSRVGVVFLMAIFGASFGFTVPGRITLLIGRARDLQKFSWASFLAMVGLIVCWELSERVKRDGRNPVEE